MRSRLAIPESRIVFGEFDAPGGRAAAEKMLRSGPVPDAIFATNDFAAFGALGVLRDRGLMSQPMSLSSDTTTFRLLPKHPFR